MVFPFVGSLYPCFFHKHVLSLFATHFLLSGDMIYTLKELGTKIVRFDANFVLGTERLTSNSTQAKAMFHPLSYFFSMLLRKNHFPRSPFLLPFFFILLMVFP